MDRVRGSPRRRVRRRRVGCARFASASRRPGRRRGRDRSGAHRTHEAATSLPVGSLEPRRSGRHPGRPDGGVGTVRLPRTPDAGSGSPHRTPGTCGLTRRTDEAAEIHEREIPLASGSDRDEAICQGLYLAGTNLPAQPGAGEHPANVRVDRRHVGVERERQHGPRRVGTDAGEGFEIGKRGRDASVVVANDRLGSGVQGERTAVVTETDPGPDDLADRRVGTRRRCRKTRRELAESSCNAPDLSLGEHRLRDEDLPRIARHPPGEPIPFGTRAHPPPADRADEAAGEPTFGARRLNCGASRRGQPRGARVENGSTQSSWVSPSIESLHV